MKHQEFQLLFIEFLMKFDGFLMKVDEKTTRKGSLGPQVTKNATKRGQGIQKG